MTLFELLPALPNGLNPHLDRATAVGPATMASFLRLGCK
jgi:hypothetical protein